MLLYVCLTWVSLHDSFGNSFSTTLAPFLSRLSLLGVTFGGLEMQLSGPKTHFGAQGAP